MEKRFIQIPFKSIRPRGHIVTDATTDNLLDDQDKPLLTTFLHGLNVARRKLSLYPPEHPQISASIGTTLNILNELFQTNPIITLGIAPNALYFEQLWLDKNDSDNQEFAQYFSSLGIASISFHSGLNGPELIRFNQLLRSDRNTIEKLGGFEQLLEQQQITHITVIPIDYEAFQANQNLGDPEETPTEDHLWETFLHGLHNGILDFGDDDSVLDLATVADIFNQKLIGDDSDRRMTSSSINSFIENSLQQPNGSVLQRENDQKLVALLEQLSPDAQREFLNSAFHSLDRHRDAAPRLLQKIPSHLLQNTIAGKSRHELNLSSRLFGLISNLADIQVEESHLTTTTKSTALSEDMVKARLDVLFCEERQDMYMPDGYQAALYSILGDKVVGTIPEEEKQRLKEQLESQSVEENYAAIIFELLDTPLDEGQEESIQQNLLQLSRHFLDIGNFVLLRKIYCNWSAYLDSDHATVSIFDEKVLANHLQMTFMTEVLDAVDLWEGEKDQEIADYISSIGEAYSELLIERLGLAPTWDERRYWMEILDKIGANARQMILQSLNDDRWYLVRNLLIILGKEVDHSSLKAIQPLTRHPHPQVRLEALRYLFSCNPATANRQLLQELESEDPDAQLAAIQIADLSHDPQVLAILHKQLEKDPATPLELEIRQHIVKALTRIGHRDSLPVLRRILQKKGLLISRRVKQLQTDIVTALASFPDTLAEKLLKELINSRYKQLALEALEARHKQVGGIK